jgi:hypothetical protein
MYDSRHGACSLVGSQSGTDRHVTRQANRCIQRLQNILHQADNYKRCLECGYIGLIANVESFMQNEE